MSTKILIDSPPQPDCGRRSIRVSYALGSVYKGGFNYRGRKYAFLSVPGAGTTSVVGYPEVPQEGFFIAVPRKVVKESVKVKVVDPIDDRLAVKVPCKKLLRPVPLPISEKEYKQGVEHYKMVCNEYEALTEYPPQGRYCELHGLRTLQGVRVAHVMIYPIHYRPQEGSLHIVPKMIIELSYDVPRDGDVLPERPGILGDMVLLSKECVTRSSPVAGKNTRKKNAVLKLRQSENAGDYMIIAPSARGSGQPFSLADAVRPLLDSKAKSFHSTLVSTEQIEAEFPDQTGHKDPKTKLKLSIRSFLDWALENWKVPPRFVVLAGDVDTIRPHHLRLKDDDTVAVYPSDHYYADLNSTLEPDLIVSRIPTSDPVRMKQICQRLANYPECCEQPDSMWRRRVLLVADNIDQGRHFSEFEECLNSIEDPRFTFIKKYAGSSRTEDVIGEINTGVVLVNYRGHGTSTSWSSTNGLKKRDIEKLDTVNMPPLVFCICCSNAQIDDAKDLYKGMDSFVETFLGASGDDEAIPKCVAIIGATRESPHLANNDFNRYLWQAIAHGERTPGGIFQRAKALMVQNHPDSDAHTRNVWMYMLLGDPAAEVIPFSKNDDIHSPGIR